MNLKRELFILIFASILINLLIWLPFIFGFQEGMITVFKNYDGPYYIVVAKTWYDKNKIARSFSLPTPLEYYPAHWPGYPAIIAIFNNFMPGPWAMLCSTLFFTVLTTIIFYLFLFKFKLSKNPFWLSLVFLVLPARWVAVKAVGSPEPLFIFAIFASFYFFKSAFDNVENNLISKKKSVFFDLFLAGIFGTLAQITKSPAILLFLSYVSYLGYLVYLKKYSLKQAFRLTIPLFLIPISALGVFFFYKIRTGDFLAYFHSGDNFHLVFPPFQGFFPERSWLGTIWNEDMIWQYLVGALTVVFLIKQKHYDLASFAGIFFTATLFITHRDLARYSLPLVPFSLIAFDEFIQKKEFKIALLIIIPAISLYAINFIAGNTAPISDWTSYL